MGDRKSFFRFWQSSSSSAPPTRRASSSQPAAPPRTAASQPPKPKPSSPPPPAPRARKPSQQQPSSPSRRSPKSKSTTPNASPSAQWASPARSPKPKEAHEQDHKEHHHKILATTTPSENNKLDEIEKAPPPSESSMAHEKPTVEAIKASSEEIQEVKEIPREEEIIKQETVDDDDDDRDSPEPAKRGNLLKFVNDHAMHSKGGIGIEPLASVIILAGENRGASLQMGSSKGRERQIHIHRGYWKETITDREEGREKAKDEAKSMEDHQQQQPETCVNNNTQGINNSIVLNSSVAEKSPGVHLTVAKIMDQLQEKGRLFTEGPKKKAEFISTNNRAENLVSKPRIRRRCLKGLMLETSEEEEEENPENPRRHGCRVGCK